MIRTNRLNKIYLISTFILSVGLITFFILRALQENIDLYLTPSQIVTGEYDISQDFRLGGMVKESSLEKLESLEIQFVVTDFQNEIVVRYTGILPNLFKENSGVVASGYLDKNSNEFMAYEILAKHDESYMPVKIEVEN
tara:strand:+ start:2250 stop:2666 length:417 start_codon:yes stop_codon:yes gene_type:complete